MRARIPASRVKENLTMWKKTAENTFSCESSENIAQHLPPWLNCNTTHFLFLMGTFREILKNYTVILFTSILGALHHFVYDLPQVYFKFSSERIHPREKLAPSVSSAQNQQLKEGVGKKNSADFINSNACICCQLLVHI